MKRGVLSVLLLCYMTIVVAQKTDLNPNIYSGIASVACKETTNGAIMITTYNTFTFSQDSVRIDYSIEYENNGVRLNSQVEESEYLGTYPYQLQKAKKNHKYLVRIKGYHFEYLEVLPDRLEEYSEKPNSSKKTFYLEK